MSPSNHLRAPHRAVAFLQTSTVDGAAQRRYSECTMSVAPEPRPRFLGLDRAFHRTPRAPTPVATPPASLPREPVRPCLAPSLPASNPGYEKRQFVQVPTNREMNALVQGASATPLTAPGSNAASDPRAVGGSTKRSAPQRGLLAIWLLHPRSSRIRQAVQDLAPAIDTESDESITWVVVGNPSESAPGGRRLLSTLGFDEAELRAKWDAAVQRHGTPEALAAHETALVAERFGVSIDEYPCLVLCIRGAPGIASRKVTLAADLDVLPRAPMELVRVLRQAFKHERVDLHFPGFKSASEHELAERLASFVTGLCSMLRGLHADLEDDRRSFQPDPTDRSILDLLRKHAGTRLPTGRIAERLDRTPGAIGKHLSKLHKLGLIDNEPRIGYAITPKGLSQG